MEQNARRANAPKATIREREQWAQRCLEPTIVLIRPSGIWNSRSPLNDYVQRIRSNERSKSLQLLGLYEILSASGDEPNRGRMAHALLGGNSKGVATSKFIENYRRSYGSKTGGTPANVDDLQKDTAYALQMVQESALVRLSSIFESFVQCGSLNFILSHLENDHNNIDSEMKKIVVRFNPFCPKNLPTAPDIIKSFPNVLRELCATPRSFKIPGTKLDFDTIKDISESAYSSIIFWRDYRNLSIHYNGIVTRKFFSTYGDYFANSFETLGHIRMQPGYRLPYHDDLYGAMGAAHYRAATVLNAALIELSSGRRGHPDAPASFTEKKFTTPPKSPSLLLLGDHASSFSWISDDSAMRRTARERGWNLTNGSVLWTDVDWRIPSPRNS